MRKELFVLACASAIALGGAGVACSSSSTTTNAGTDSGVNTHPANDDSGTGGGTDSGSGDIDSGSGDTDSGGAADAGLNGCSTFTDNTAKAEVDLTWDFTIANQADRCTKIKAGKVVKWTGSFTVHPLEAFGGDANNPITGTAPDAGAISVTFPAAGVFGYNCQNHPNQMFGVVVVVP